MQTESLNASTEIPNSQIELAKLTIWAIPMFWTVNHIVARKAPGVITPHVLAIARWALVGIFLAWLARDEIKAHWDILRTQTRRYLLLGALGMWVCGAGVYQAGVSTNMINISLIYASSPVMIAVGSVLWLSEPFSKRQALGVLLAVLGVVHGQPPIQPVKRRMLVALKTALATRAQNQRRSSRVKRHRSVKY